PDTKCVLAKPAARSRSCPFPRGEIYLGRRAERVFRGAASLLRSVMIARIASGVEQTGPRVGHGFEVEARFTAPAGRCPELWRRQSLGNCHGKRDRVALSDHEPGDPVVDDVADEADVG